MDYDPTPPLRHRHAVVTGGARGIGYALARGLARHGAAVTIMDRLDTVPEQGDRLADETGGTCRGVEVDVADSASVERAFDLAESHLGTPSILINAAGITSGTAALDIPPHEWEQVMSVNVTGTLLTCQQFARRFAADGQREAGSIINISSMSAFAVNVPQTQAAYNTSKAAVSMLTKSLGIEWLPLGIRVNAIAPGYIASDMTRDFVADHPDMAEEWIGRIPARRMGSPEELVDLAVYLASERSSYVVGQSFVADGGYTAV